MSTFLQDLKYALRVLTKNPAFAAIAVMVLALGIGANTAIFSVVNGVLLQPLPYHEPAGLMNLAERTPEFSTMSVAYPNFVDWKDQSRSFASMAAYRWESYDITGGNQPEHLSAKMVSADFFRVLGIKPVVGRDFEAQEDRLGTAPVIMISGGMWKRRFASSPSALGKALTLNGRDYTVIGVVPADFELRGNADVYSLMGQWDNTTLRTREMHSGTNVLGRLKPGVGQAQAQADLDAIARRLAEAYPQSNTKHGVSMTPLTEVIVGDIRPTLLVLLGAVAFVLLIACANVANLLLARSTGRRREIAIRAALGASRGRAMRQLLTESVLLAVVGGAAGLAIAKWGTHAVVAAVPGGLPRVENIAMDGWVLAFTLLMSLATGIIFGLVPALQVSVTDVRETLNEGSRGSTAGPQRLRSLLVISEVAAALVLLVGAGLMLRTISQLNGVNPGFDPNHVLTFSMSLSPEIASSGDRILQNFDRTLNRISAVPGVKSAAVTTLLPMDSNDSEIPFYVNGRPKPASQGDMLWALLYCTTPEYLKTMGIPLLRGRYITPQDSSHSARVIVIDEMMAKKVFPGEDPIGKSIVVADLGGNLPPELSKPMQIVGVTGHTNHWGLDSDVTAKIRSEIFLPVSQIPEVFLKGFANGSTFVVRTGGDPLSAVPPVRRAVLESGSEEPIYSVRTMQEIVSASTAGRRFSMVLLAIFAVLALVLAAGGIYGVISYTVAQRTHEIGIRMALGAKTTDVVTAVIRQGMIPVITGIAIGLAASFWLTRLMSNMLYGVTSTDPVTFVGVAAVLAGVALLANYIPARRATKVDPMIALRYE